MKITRFETRILRHEATDTLDPSAETLLVLLGDERGNVGVGETDAPASVVEAFLTMPTAHEWCQGFTEMLIGENPVEIVYLWEKMYHGTIWAGRRGLGIHALSAVDIALHDLVGQRLGLPVYQLLGGRRRETLTPYATVYVGSPRRLTRTQIQDALLSRLAFAVERGFRAVKMEVLFGDLISDTELISVIREGRRTVGDAVTLLLDFGCRFAHWKDAARVLRRTDDCDIFLAEATLQPDDLAGHARLADAVGVRIGGAEMAATRFECQEWIEQGKADVLQPDINRCGGLTEIRRIAQMAENYGVEVIPHAWKTGVTVAACRHFQACTPNAPYFELLTPELWDSPLRAELTRPEPALRADGTMPLPDAPGLGAALQEEALRKFAVHAGARKPEAQTRSDKRSPTLEPRLRREKRPLPAPHPPVAASRL